MQKSVRKSESRYSAERPEAASVEQISNVDEYYSLEPPIGGVGQGGTIEEEETARKHQLRTEHPPTRKIHRRTK
jgi:hypothetical protein